MTRKALAFTLLPLAAGIGQQQAFSQTRPNVVLILADDLGYGGVTCYGGDSLSTPNIDNLFKGGLACTNYHAAPVSSATRVTLMTGSYQQRVGLNGIYSATDKMDGLDPKTHPSFAKSLKAAGYSTAIYGKWHLGLDTSLNPVEHGFDDFRGFLIGNIDLVSHRDRFNMVDWWHNQKVEDEPGIYGTYLINQHSVDFIHAKAHSDSPFFLFVSHGAIHVPMVGPNDPTTRDGMELCMYRNDTDMTKQEYARVYREMIKTIDDGVGQIVSALKEEGILDNTVIIFMSDNGAEQVAGDKYDGANGYFRGYKGTTFEGGTRVPAIFYWPGHFKTGQNDELMNSMDIMPTIMDLCNVNYDKTKIDGTSLLPTIEKGKKMPSRKIFSANMGYASLTDGKYKLVWGTFGTMLFNIKKDKFETTDLASKYPEVAQKMKNEIIVWWNDCTKGTKLEGQSPVPDKPIGNLAQILKYE